MPEKKMPVTDPRHPGHAAWAAKMRAARRAAQLRKEAAEDAKREKNMARKKTVRRGVWIKASAFRFNKDGSVSMIKPTARQRNVAGYKDAYGFHPIRWDDDYDPSELQKEEPGYATDHTQPRAHRGRGGRMIPGFFVGSRKKKRPAAKKKRRPAAKKRRR